MSNINPWTLLILGILVGLIVPRLMEKPEKARRVKAQLQIESISMALKEYKLDNGDYPTTEQGLQALRTKPGGVERWDGPYLPKNVPLDPWGHAYEYRSPGEHGEYDIISLGADGTSGGEGENEDVVNWKDIGATGQ